MTGTSLAAATWLGWVVAWVLAGGAFGAIVGVARDRVLLGVALGALLGPIGWIIVARSRSALLECPGCSRLISRAAHVCPRCGTNVRDAQLKSSRSTLRRVDRSGHW